MRLLKPIFHNLEAYRWENWRPADGRNLTITCSGGRSSAYQLWHIVEANGGLPKDVLVHFNNTSREREETLVFVDMIDSWLGLGIHWLEADPTRPEKVRRVDFKSAARKGEIFDAMLTEIVPKRRDGTSGVRPLPNPVQRSCTSIMKIKALHRYVRRTLSWPTDYYSALGYRSDEPRRVERALRRQNKKRWLEGGNGVFPMFYAGVDQERVARFWMHAPFDLELDSAHGNCDYCFMVSTWKLKERMVIEAIECGIRLRPGAELPPRLARWVNDEERETDRAGPYRRDRPPFRVLWEQVCAGDMQSATPENVDDVCQACTDL